MNEARYARISGKKATHDRCTLLCACVIADSFSTPFIKCGFFIPEAERRKPIPLTPGEDGLYRKMVGVPND